MEYHLSFSTSYPVAFVMGLFSSLHCIGMCGSIIGALTLSLDASVRSNNCKLLPFIASYNIGRITSYSLAGLIVGLFQYVLSWSVGEQIGYRLLQWTSAIVMLAAGFYIAGWFPRFAYIEKLGTNIWYALEPVGKKFMPVKNIVQAFLFGSIWGWLPCGLVYTALALAAAAGDVSRSALTMLSFGIGTLPAVMGMGIMTNNLAKISKLQYIRQLVGILFIILALLAAFPSVNPLRLKHF